MEHQITVRLTDQEYGALTAVAARSGKPPETILHEYLLTFQKILVRLNDNAFNAGVLSEIILHELMMSEKVQEHSSAKSPLTEQEFMEQLYHEGVLLNIPSRRPLTAQEQALREHLAQVFSGGKPASEMVIEDRGPY